MKTIELVHHTTKHALKEIINDKKIYPVFDCVWMTTSQEGEATAGLHMPNEHKGRVVLNIPLDLIHKFNDIYEKFPHLNIVMLNAITDTKLWYLSDEPIPDKYFTSTDVMNEFGEWIPYESRVRIDEPCKN